MSFQYLAQDFSWNSRDSDFILPLHYSAFRPGSIENINRKVQYQKDGDSWIAIFQHQSLSALVHCKCKKGTPTQDLAVRFESETSVRVQWPDVTRLFARVRLMDTDDLDNFQNMLQDDIEGGYSLSDVDRPEENQSRRPWSDEDDSETETVDEVSDSVS